MDFERVYATNEWVVQLVFFVLMMAAGEVGFRRGRRAMPSTSDKVKAQISVVEASLLGVVGLLLGFTMSMAVSRYEVRKQLVLAEANAIGTSYLRTRVLPARAGDEIANLLREYVDLRLRYSDSDDDLDRINATRRRAQELQREFWTRAVDYNRSDPNPVRSGLLLQSLNDVIDLESSRWMAFSNHVPAPVIIVNAAVAWFAAILVGYAFGIDGKRQAFPMCLLAVAITVVLGVIMDLDRPRQGFIHVSQQPMTDLQLEVRAAPRNGE